MNKPAVSTADKYGNTRITVKGIKYAAFASEETNCFTASVYLDGKRLGEAHNEGHGGETWFHSYMVDDKVKMAEAEAYAESLPASVYESSGPHPDFPDLPPAPPMELPMTLELLIGSIVEDSLQAKSEKAFETKMKRLCNTKVVLKSGEKYFTLNCKYQAQLKNKIVALYPNATIMNEVWNTVYA